MKIDNLSLCFVSFCHLCFLPDMQSDHCGPSLCHWVFHEAHGEWVPGAGWLPRRLGVDRAAHVGQHHPSLPPGDAQLPSHTLLWVPGEPWGWGEGSSPRLIGALKNSSSVSVSWGMMSVDSPTGCFHSAQTGAKTKKLVIELKLILWWLTVNIDGKKSVFGCFTGF